MIEFLKSLFISEEAIISPPSRSFLGNMETGSNTLLKYHTQTKCKIHWDYHGLSVPINNCSKCWQMYSEKQNGN